ncbi:uncharacterized protein KNAG_0L00520 [Huiozyma naganishii CBS 8797]|uniref:non-specific serine/threonine protein kinase n=1 Tax=Huiozyma naganishii (strain ATCC MYA-139 / BCRC 22969 / CBS 8797 / KCTC 17520 / NBRC 10181 / NCYC 3082 / Yp74L-3) TaxID=1071383 RepID=J7RCS4_HUIN7|nr:hypothetical protein KNAG_0L00520 [Kazachstania naganishii CBS 8797]CCK72675.1 hypothetical protein KNAG_0L00520 [Kazachstania naganishii CBS 8797]
MVVTIKEYADAVPYPRFPKSALLDLSTSCSSMASLSTLDEEDASGNANSLRYIEAMKLYVMDKAAFLRRFSVDEAHIITMLNKQETLLTADVSTLGARKRVKKFSDYEVVLELGQGAYGQVSLVQNKSTEEFLILKKIFKERILLDTWVRDRKYGTVPSEIHILTKLTELPHDNVVSMIDFFEDDDFYYVEMPIHGQGDGCIELFDFIDIRDEVSDWECKLIIKQLVSAIKYLHDRDIVHRDIKDENIIMDARGHIQLIDFGSATNAVRGPFRTFLGTIDYEPPEVARGEPFLGKPQDIWALGILLYILRFKEPPFLDQKAILTGDLKFPQGTSVNTDCIDLINAILSPRVDERPTIDDIVEHKWLQF